MRENRGISKNKAIDFLAKCLLVILLLDWVELFITKEIMYSSQPILTYQSQFFILQFVREYIGLFSLFYLVLIIVTLISRRKWTWIILFFTFGIKFHLNRQVLNWGDYILYIDLLFLSMYYIFYKSGSQIAKTISKLCYYSLVIHTIYLFGVNIFFKLQSPIWQSGEGIICALRHVMENGNWILDFAEKKQLILKYTSYLVLLFQFSILLYLFLPKKIRFIILTIGVFQYVVIGMVFSIPIFSAIVIIQLFFLEKVTVQRI